VIKFHFVEFFNNLHFHERETMKIKLAGKALIIFGLMSAVGFGLYKSDFFNSPVASQPQVKVEQRVNAPAVQTEAPKQQPQPVAASGEIGSKKNPLKVSIVSFHGYAPGLMANGGMKTSSSSINARNGVEIEYLLQDDVPTLSTLFQSGVAQCAWRTSDFWAQEHPNLRNAKGDGKAVMIVDNTQGGDAVIARDPSIKSIEDLAGKSVALLQFTPSHGLIQDAIENSSLTPRKKQSIKMVYINADEGTGGVRAAYESGKVDAAVLWDPDLSLALRSGGHVVYSTKQASNLIYDVMVCDSKVLKTQTGRDAIQKFVAGWMEAVPLAKANPDAAVDILAKTEEMFTLLKKQEGVGFIKGLFVNLKWTGLEDNIRILGMANESNHYERVYKQFDQIYRTAGALANPNSPVINPADSFDYSFIKNLASASPTATKAAEQETVTFTSAELNRVASKKAAVTKPVIVTFNSGSSELTQRSKKQIDVEMVPFIENNGTAYIEISGNTDSVGTDAVNVPLSKARAAAVANYLVTQWGFQKARFNVIGLGSSKPICDERSGELPLDQCREMNRSTRVAILGR
jgi:outer membrane protein OmpA-like peptidoglycan-associated protein